jgi:hypothetical protein
VWCTRQEEQRWDERTAAFDTLLRPLVEPLAAVTQVGDSQQLYHPDVVGRLNKALRYAAFMRRARAHTHHNFSGGWDDCWSGVCRVMQGIDGYRYACGRTGWEGVEADPCAQFHGCHQGVRAAVACLPSA